MTEEDIHTVAEAVAAVARNSLATLRMQQESVVDQVLKNLNQLVEAINDFKATVEDETYGMDPSISLVMPDLVLPIKITI